MHARPHPPAPRNAFTITDSLRALPFPAVRLQQSARARTPLGHPAPPPSSLDASDHLNGCRRSWSRSTVQGWRVRRIRRCQEIANDESWNNKPRDLAIRIGAVNWIIVAKEPNPRSEPLSKNAVLALSGAVVIGADAGEEAGGLARWRKPEHQDRNDGERSPRRAERSFCPPVVASAFARRRGKEVGHDASRLNRARGLFSLLPTG